MSITRSFQARTALGTLALCFAAACGSAEGGDTDTTDTTSEEPSAPPAATTYAAPLPADTGADGAARSRASSRIGRSGTSADAPATPAAALPAPVKVPAPEAAPTPAPEPAPAPAPAPAPEATPTPTPEPAPAPPSSVAYRGVNLAGAEFGSAIPGKENSDYKWPTTSEVDYFLGKGMNTFRVGFKWERMQPQAKGGLDAVYLSRLESLVGYITSKGATAILNPHNFAMYYGVSVGSSTVPDAVFADFWGKLAAKFAANPKVIFNLTNEPHDLPTEQWVGAANAAIAAIRGTGAKNLLHVPGNGWTGAHAWHNAYYGTPNATAMLKIADPANNMVFEVHQYLDANSGGQSDQCISTTIGRERIQGFVDWLRANGKRGFIGEFAGGNNATCNAAVEDMLNAMNEAADVLDGWLWWAAGPWWRENYPYTIEPKDGVDRPQMALLSKYL